VVVAGDAVIVQSILPPQPIHAICAHGVPTSRQRDLDGPIAVARILGCDSGIEAMADASRSARR
jgi:hypothetical protein